MAINTPLAMSGNSLIVASLPEITVLNKETIMGKPKGRCNILPWERRA